MTKLPLTRTFLLAALLAGCSLAPPGLPSSKLTTGAQEDPEQVAAGQAEPDEPGLPLPQTVPADFPEEPGKLILMYKTGFTSLAATHLEQHTNTTSLSVLSSLDMILLNTNNQQASVAHAITLAGFLYAEKDEPQRIRYDNSP